MSANRRQLLLVFGAIVTATFALALLLARYQQKTQFSAVPSSFNPSPYGTKAAYVTLEKLGLPVRRWQYSWSKLAHERGVLIVTAHVLEEAFGSSGALSFGEEESKALARWVRAGNTVVVFATSDLPLGDSAGQLLKAFDLRLRYSPQREAPSETTWTSSQRKVETYRALMPSPWTHGVESVAIDGAMGLRTTQGVIVPLVEGEDSRLHAFWVPRGPGRLVVFSTTAFIDNEFIARGDNLPLLLNIVGRAAQGGAILFDEYHHGFSSEFAMIDFLRLPLVRLAGAQLVVLVVLLIASQWRRFGEPVPLVRETRRSVMEYAVSLGDLYARAETQLEALDYLYGHLRRELINRFGLRAEANAAEVAVRLGAGGESRRLWEQIAEDCEAHLASRKLTRQQFAQLARRVQQFRSQLR